MIKKVLAIGLIIFTMNNVYAMGHSCENTEIKSIRTIPTKEYKLIMPAKDLVISEETVLISGKAKKDSMVSLNLYTSENLLYTEKEIKTEVGELGRFNVELKLPLGRNKVVVSIQNSGESYIFTREIYITSDEIAKEYLENPNRENEYTYFKEIIEVIESN